MTHANDCNTCKFQAKVKRENALFRAITFATRHSLESVIKTFLHKEVEKADKKELLTRKTSVDNKCLIYFAK